MIDLQELESIITNYKQRHTESNNQESKLTLDSLYSSNTQIFLYSTLLLGGTESTIPDNECYFGKLDSTNNLIESKPIYQLIDELDSNNPLHTESTNISNLDSNNTNLNADSKRDFKDSNTDNHSNAESTNIDSNNSQIDSNNLQSNPTQSQDSNLQSNNLSNTKSNGTNNTPNTTDSNNANNIPNITDSNNANTQTHIGISTLNIFLGSQTLTILNYSLLDSSLNITLESKSKESQAILEKEKAQKTQANKVLQEKRLKEKNK